MRMLSCKVALCGLNEVIVVLAISLLLGEGVAGMTWRERVWVCVCFVNQFF